MEREPVQTPCIRLESEEGDLVLHWFNTRIRRFDDPQYDHVEYRDEEGQLKGLRLARYVIDTMVEHKFPSQFDPVVDEATFEWFVQAEAAHIDEELGEL